MHEISINLPYKEVEKTIEILQLNDFYNTYYNAPFEVTTEKYGYGYFEKKNENISLKIVIEGNRQEAEKQLELIKKLIAANNYEINSIETTSDTIEFEPIDLKNGWFLASPHYECNHKKKINFIPQGAFGTGLHETTQDCLRFILDENFIGKKVLDIGTGSGILSIGAALKGAEKVFALDIRDVRDEIELNASLNSIDNIDVLVGNALNGEITINERFQWIFINIGGEETQMFMPLIASHITSGGKLLLSGLVEWSFNSVINEVEKYNFTLIKKVQSNEWCTAILIENKVNGS
ncbi:hypothetical protein CPJCM30710_07900 [Clostridium polyendosporum]|uniref:Ribosomal protein L11 methyltransferase n=1 Tax=Clostridium polyendosporum TaxID=69208 RepID=A0A919VDK9_9CLOT|nr:50S ribosomal protein L11 methyltransferase [Clostridium polyendosporum]GIM28124.1 hypothetical protein CPJCM30710_07900 [Clostridium polyendosporum]